MAHDPIPIDSDQMNLDNNDKKYSHDQVVRMMNTLLNTALISPATSNNHIRIKKYPCSNSIADFVNEFMKVYRTVNGY